MENNLVNKVKELYKESNGIKKEVLSYLIELDNDEEVVNWLRDLIGYGVAGSGLASELIYNSDINDFFNFHWKEINEILKEEILDECMHLDKFVWFDKSDPLIREQHNINNVSWFAFEVVANRIANELGIEY